MARAALIAGFCSGIPSTLHALLTAPRDVLASVRAAGTVLGRSTIPRGVLAHAVLTVGWTAVIAAVPPARRSVASGAAAGVVIGLVDLAVARRRLPAIAALPALPQLLDHAAFGALVAASLRRGPDVRRGGAARPSP